MSKNQQKINTFYFLYWKNFHQRLLADFTNMQRVFPLSRKTLKKPIPIALQPVFIMPFIR